MSFQSLLELGVNFGMRGKIQLVCHLSHFLGYLERAIVVAASFLNQRLLLVGFQTLSFK